MLKDEGGATSRNRLSSRRNNRSGRLFKMWIGLYSVGFTACLVGDFRKLQSVHRIVGSSNYGMSISNCCSINVVMKDVVVGSSKVVLPSRRLRISKMRDFAGLDISYRARVILEEEQPLPVFVGEDRTCTEETCRRNLLNCNTIHELGLETAEFHGSMKKVGSGAYRDAFLANINSPGSGSEPFVYKRLHAKSFVFSSDPIATIRAEAQTMEDMTSSPNILDLYGYCYGSVLVESGRDVQSLWDAVHEKRVTVYGGQRRVIVSKKDGKVVSKSIENRTETTLLDMSWDERLSLAIQSVQSISDLHGAGYAHLDMKTDQFLVFNGTIIKLNDFNRARKLEQDPQTKEYSTLMKSAGNLKSCNTPESCHGGVQGQKTDIFNFGTVLYMLRTGSQPQPFWKERVYQRSDMPLYDQYDSFTYEEQRYMSIVYRCWRQSYDRRPSADTVLAMLKAIQSTPTR